MSQQGIPLSQLRHNSSAASTLGTPFTHFKVTHHANFRTVSVFPDPVQKNNVAGLCADGMELKATPQATGCPQA